MMVSTVFYYVVVAVLSACTAVMYCSGQIARACFCLIGAGILLILNEIKRNAKIVNTYHNCEFITTPIPNSSPGTDTNGEHKR